MELNWQQETAPPPVDPDLPWKEETLARWVDQIDLQGIRKDATQDLTAVLTLAVMAKNHLSDAEKALCWDLLREQHRVAMAAAQRVQRQQEALQELTERPVLKCRFPAAPDTQWIDRLKHYGFAFNGTDWWAYETPEARAIHTEFDNFLLREDD